MAALAGGDRATAAGPMAPAEAALLAELRIVTADASLTCPRCQHMLHDPIRLPCCNVAACRICAAAAAALAEESGSAAPWQSICRNDAVEEAAAALRAVAARTAAAHGGAGAGAATGSDTALHARFASASAAVRAVHPSRPSARAIAGMPTDTQLAAAVAAVATTTSSAAAATSVGAGGRTIVPVCCMDVRAVPATAWCADCCEHYCNDCWPLRHQKKLTSHSRLLLRHGSSATGACATHPRMPLDTFCRPERKAVCEVCLMHGCAAHAGNTVAADELAGVIAAAAAAQADAAVAWHAAAEEIGSRAHHAAATAKAAASFLAEAEASIISRVQALFALKRQQAANEWRASIEALGQQEARLRAIAAGASYLAHRYEAIVPLARSAGTTPLLSVQKVAQLAAHARASTAGHGAATADAGHVAFGPAAVRPSAAPAGGSVCMDEGDVDKALALLEGAITMHWDLDTTPEAGTTAAARAPVESTDARPHHVAAHAPAAAHPAGPASGALTPEPVSFTAAPLGGKLHKFALRCSSGDTMAIVRPAEASGHSSSDGRITILDVAKREVRAEGCDLGTLLRPFTGVALLDVSRSRFSAVQAASLASAVARMARLQYLDVNTSQLTATGAIALAEALANAPELLCLNVSHNNLQPAGASALVQAATNLPRLKQLLMSSTHMGKAGAAALVAALPTFRQVQSVKVKGNDLDETEKAALRASAPKGCHVRC